MRIGDLIEWSDKLWVVRSFERATRTVILKDADFQAETIQDDLDKTAPETCRVIANPSNDWPVVVTDMRPKLGRLVRISRPSLQVAESVLKPLEEWVVGDPMQPGGALFFNPLLNLRLGDILVAHYERGTARITIPRLFLSAREKAVRAATPAEPPKRSIYDRLRRNVYSDDD